jgi:glucose-6-phosphate-specific signal transduction histidine kinase
MGGRDDLTVRVTVRDGDGALRVNVADDGTGTGAGTPGLELVGMRERVRSVSGTLDAGPGPQKGFEVIAVLPLPSADGRQDSKDLNRTAARPVRATGSLRPEGVR